MAMLDVRLLKQSDKTMAHAKGKITGFEESLSQLENIVSQLESGDLPLERALEIFEEGVGLARQCQSHLAEAERKVEMLLRERGEIKTVPFDGAAEITEINAPRNISPAPKAAAPTTVPTIDFDDDIPF
jgi:exodeoxyribonuclease VII small subunit